MSIGRERKNCCRDLGLKRNVRSLYNLQVEDEDDRMDMDIDDGMDLRERKTNVRFEDCCSLRDEEQKVATKFDDIDINSDEQHYQTIAFNVRKSRRRYSVNSGVCSSSRNTSRQPIPIFQQPLEGRKPCKLIFPISSACSSSTPPLMVAFYHPETYEEAIFPVDDVGFSFSNADEIVHQNQVEDPLNRLSPETPLTKINADAPTVDSASHCTYMERVSNREYAQNRRGSVVSNKSMCPGGFLSVRRLDPGLDHIPIEARSNSRNKPKLKCAMHRWLGDRKEGNLGHCRTCNVNLCTDCYYLFHTIDGTDKIREEFS